MATTKKDRKKGDTVRPRVRPGQKNKNDLMPCNLRLKTPAARIAMFKSYCQHLREGYSRESFPDLSYEAAEEYVAKFPDELDQEEMHAAWRFGRKIWEYRGMQGTLGSKYKNFKSTAYIFIMQNMYGMKQRVDITGKTTSESTHTIVELTLPDNDRAYRND